MRQIFALVSCLLISNPPSVLAEPVTLGESGSWQPAITPAQYEAKLEKKPEPPLTQEEEKEIVRKLEEIEEKKEFFEQKDDRDKILSFDPRADLNQDGRVNAHDRMLEQEFRKFTASPPDRNGDYNQDGIRDLDDVNYKRRMDEIEKIMTPQDRYRDNRAQTDWNGDGMVDAYDLMHERKITESIKDSEENKRSARQQVPLGEVAEKKAWEDKNVKPVREVKTVPVAQENADGNDKLLRVILATGFKIPVPHTGYNRLFAAPSDRFISVLQLAMRNLSRKFLQAQKQVRRKSLDPEILVHQQLLQHLKQPPDSQLAQEEVAGMPEDGVPEAADYVAVESVSVDKALAAAHFLMNPPKSLHPFLRMLFYRRMVTPEIAYWYFSTLEKIRAIYQEAKEGKGQIRYKGKICDAYFPLPDEMGGVYELVVPKKTEFEKSEHTTHAVL